MTGWLGRREYVAEERREAVKEVRKRQVPRLSPRERQVLLAVEQGLKDHQIALALFITRETVRTHIKRAAAKLGCRAAPHASYRRGAGVCSDARDDAPLSHENREVVDELGVVRTIHIELPDARSAAQRLESVRAPVAPAVASDEPGVRPVHLPLRRGHLT